MLCLAYQAFVYNYVLIIVINVPDSIDLALEIEISRSLTPLTCLYVSVNKSDTKLCIHSYMHKQVLSSLLSDVSAKPTVAIGKSEVAM